MIVDKTFDWSEITIKLPIGTSFTAQSIEYEDGLEVEAVYGRGSMPIGYGEGKYEASGKITLLMEEFELLKAALAADGRGAIYRHKPVLITVAYAKHGAPVIMDELLQCKFPKIPKKASQGDKSLPIDLEFQILGGIIHNGTPGDIQT